MAPSNPDSPERETTRRQLLSSVGAAGLVGLAGCSGDDSGTDPTETDAGAGDDGGTATETGGEPTPTATGTERNGNGGNGTDGATGQTWRSFRHNRRNIGHDPGLTGPDASVRAAWSFAADALVRSPPTVDEQRVYVGSWDGNVYALDRTDGTEQWAVQFGGWVDAAPAVDDGSERWSFETGGSVECSPAVVNGTVYVGSRDTQIYALTE